MDFSLPTTTGKSISLSNDFLERNSSHTAEDEAVPLRVLCFLGAECPLARIYGPRLNRMHEQYASRGVRFIGINSNIQDSMQDTKEYVIQHDIAFPVAKDFDRTVAIAAGATRTPEVVVLDRQGHVRYRGRIDDQYEPGIARKKASQHHLIDAIDQLLAGKIVSTPRTETEGCLIALPRKSDGGGDITFCKQIKRILQTNCIECHREGEIGPFGLRDYDEVIGWGDMMIEVIDESRMPPWHASPDHGSFSNTRFMPDEDKHMIRAWVDAGMPYGHEADLPAPLVFTDGWQLPSEPDLVLDMHKTAFSVPADGTVEYQYFVVDPKFTEDKWVTAAEVIPGNRAVVHHCIVFVRPRDGDSISDFGMLAGYVPGQRPSVAPEGYARRVQAGSKLVFQMHYTPNGKPQTDLSRLGMIFADEKEVTHEVIGLGLIEQEFEIPPHNSDFVVESSLDRFPEGSKLLSITPHMHLRGKSFDFFADTDDGTTTLLKVPTYDFNWQHNYELNDPINLDDVKSLRFKATFDNSNQNPTNPDPSEYVTWGDQSWQEMALSFIAVAKPLVTVANQTKMDHKAEKEITKLLKTRRDNARKRSKKFAKDYINRLDKNGDGHITQQEMPHSVRIYHFWSLERNGDGVITLDEVEEHAYDRFISNP